MTNKEIIELVELNLDKIEDLYEGGKKTTKISEAIQKYRLQVKNKPKLKEMFEQFIKDRLVNAIGTHESRERTKSIYLRPEQKKPETQKAF